MKRDVSSSMFIAAVLTGLIISCRMKERSADPVTDIDGNTYRTEQIGNQIWMAENLRTGRFNDKTIIPVVDGSIGWSELEGPGFCWYNNDENGYKENFGALYNGYSVNTGKLCPADWHVPSHDDWEELRDFLGDTITAGGKLKETGTLNWKMPNALASNSTGFNALPAGIRYFESSFSTVKSFTAFWSSTETETNSN